jgi:penicillin-binding protein 1A
MASARKRRPGSGRGAFVRRLVLATLTLGVLGTAAVGALGYLFYTEIEAALPPVDNVVSYKPPIATQILASDGTVIGEFFNEKRYLVPLARIPQHVRQAFLAAEDDAFYEHKGVSPVGILRAFINNLAAGGKKVQGGSTITQQVVKSLLLTSQKSYERKIKEIILSIRLEEQLPKDRILELYLNHIYLGSGAHGVAAAANEYFGKDIADVTLAEAALLAGLPQAPSSYPPFQHWQRAKGRQRYVLGRMFDVGFISREERDLALQRPIALATRKGSFRAASYFVEEVRRSLEQKYGTQALYDLGLRVHTTVDLRLQDAAERALRNGLNELAQRHGNYRASYRQMDADERAAYRRFLERSLRGVQLDPNHVYEAIVTAVQKTNAEVRVGPFRGLLALPKEGPPLQLDDFLLVRLEDEEAVDPPRFVIAAGPPLEGALVGLDPTTGYVRAMVGGYDFERSQFNRATQARRQPGSAFKPLVFAAALDRNMTPASVIIDEPISYNDHGRAWTPQNFEKRYYGPTTLREALTHSRNVVAVKLADRIGIGYLVGYLPHFGLDQSHLARNLSLALGSAEVTPLELADAYSTFANDGRLPRPILITEITDHRGQVLEHFAPEAAEAIPATTAYMITSMLQDVVRRGTGTRARGLGHPTAGKTGTTNDLHDAWFVGYTPQMLAAVWVGFDNKRSLGETGGRVAAPIWKEFMAEAMKGLDNVDFAVPSGLKCVQIDPSGTRAQAEGEGARLECFRAGTEPQPGSIPAIQLVTGDHANESSSTEFLRNDF